MRTEEMKKMRYEDGMTLKQIGDVYGISRERVRQLLGNTGRFFRQNWTRKKFNEINLEEVQDVHTLPGVAKTWKEIWSNYRHPVNFGSNPSMKKGIEFEELANTILINNGHVAKLMPFAHPFDILLNNKVRIDVKHSDFDVSTLESQKSKTPTYPIANLKGGADCDFFIVFVPLGEDYSPFVIPSREVAGLDRIRISWPPTKKPSKWHKFFDRFDLLGMA